MKKKKRERKRKRKKKKGRKKGERDPLFLIILDVGVYGKKA